MSHRLMEKKAKWLSTSWDLTEEDALLLQTLYCIMSVVHLSLSNNNLFYIIDLRLIGLTGIPEGHTTGTDPSITTGTCAGSSSYCAISGSSS